MTAAGKDTIYIDIDDEITSIIDKLHSSPHQIVALVLPKRATMLQSSVNMKLLKRAADGKKKNLVLITSEAGLLPLAGAVGMHVAKTLQSKPEIPEAGLLNTTADDALNVVDEPAEDFDPTEVADKPIGDLAGLPAAEPEEEAAETHKVKPELAPRPIPKAKAESAAATGAVALDADDTIDVEAATDEPVAPEVVSRAKKKASKKQHVPNFEKFRLRLILGGALLILLIVGWIVANIVLPKATITVATNASNVNTNVAATLDTGAKALDATKLVVPATVQSTQKTASQQVPTTGKKNEGTPASGQITLSLSDCSQNEADIPAGTGVTTAGLTFITQTSVVLNTVIVGGKCKNNIPGISSSQVNVTSLNAGTQYNVGPSSFTVSNHANVAGSSSSAMTGGTDNIIQSVTQADIDGATQKIVAPDANAVKAALQTALQGAGLYPLPVTFNAGAPSTTSSANVGDQATTVTVTQTTTYTMFGAHQSDLQALIAASANKQIDTSKQALLDDGFAAANFTLVSQGANSAQVTMQTTATAGPHLDADNLKKQIMGKKAGDVKALIESNPGVTGVTVHFSPFWVTSTPKKLNKITLTIEQPKASSAKP